MRMRRFRLTRTPTEDTVSKVRRRKEVGRVPSSQRATSTISAAKTDGEIFILPNSDAERKWSSNGPQPDVTPSPDRIPADTAD